MTRELSSGQAPAAWRLLRLTLVLFLCLGGAEALAGPLRGTVRDASTGEPVPGATIDIAGTDASATSGVDGAFVIDDVEFARVTLLVLSDVYAPHEQSFALLPGVANSVVVLLEPTSEVIEMTGQAPTAVITPGQSNLDRVELRTAPGSRGDIVQAVRSLPGMGTAQVNTGALGALIVVRGTAPDDSAFLIDGVPIPSASHFGDPLVAKPRASCRVLGCRESSARTNTCPGVRARSTLGATCRAGRAGGRLHALDERRRTTTRHPYRGR
jgi:Carboxypeptidase regulatory-like domain